MVKAKTDKIVIELTATTGSLGLPASDSGSSGKGNSMGNGAGDDPGGDPILK